MMIHLHRATLLEANFALQQQIQHGENIAAVARIMERRRRRGRRRMWVRLWLQRRPLQGMYEQLMAELEREDAAGFKNFVRVEPQMFYELLQRLGPRLTKQDSWYRKALNPGLKLAITLRYLASGDSYHSMMYGFRVAHNTISGIVREVCEAIIAEYANEVVSCPTTPEGWKAVADQFGARWQFHHALGAIDGKHIAIICPDKSGSVYYNYKGFFSIVLLALVDADYKFMWVNVGSNGSSSDAQVFNHCDLKEAIENGTIGFPPPDALPCDDRQMPYFLIGDDAFALRTWMMKPYSRRRMTDQERIFNYRLSRARRIVENAFGILAARFGCLLNTLLQDTDTLEAVVLACICLHNLMRIRYPAMQNAALDQEDDDHVLIPGEWRQGRNLQDVMNRDFRGNRVTAAGQNQRDYLKEYYNSPAGAVPWQNNMI